MVMLKLWTLLLAYALMDCQMYITQAAPSSKDSLSDGVTLLDDEDDAQKLLRSIKEFMQVIADEQDSQTVDDSSLDRPMTKRCTGLSTCVLGKLSQDIHRLQTYPRTNVGAGTPGKKRSLSEQYKNFVNLKPFVLSPPVPMSPDNATVQKRGCNTATCVTHRLADFLSRSGGLGHANYVPTNVGAQAFGRRKRRGHV